MVKKLIICAILSVVLVRDCFSGVFAKDKLILYEDRSLIKDNSVIVCYLDEDEYEVCANGYIWTIQSQKPLELIFYKTSGDLPSEIKEWWHTEEGEDDISWEKYKEYLKERAKKADYKISLIIPEKSENLSYETREGKPGEARYFMVDIKKGEISQIMRYKRPPVYYQ